MHKLENSHGGAKIKIYETHKKKHAQLRWGCCWSCPCTAPGLLPPARSCGPLRPGALLWARVAAYPAAQKPPPPPTPQPLLRQADRVAGGFFEGAAFASSPPPLPPFAPPSSPRQPCRTLARGGDCCRPVGVRLGWHRRRWPTVKAAMPTLRLRHDVKFPEFKFTDLHVLFHYIKLSYVNSLNINTLFMCSID